jgi:hypothetical protein
MKPGRYHDGVLVYPFEDECIAGSSNNGARDAASDRRGKGAAPSSGANDDAPVPTMRGAAVGGGGDCDDPPSSCSSPTLSSSSSVASSSESDDQRTYGLLDLGSPPALADGADNKTTVAWLRAVRIKREQEDQETLPQPGMTRRRDGSPAPRGPVGDPCDEPAQLAPERRAVSPAPRAAAAPTAASQVLRKAPPSLKLKHATNKGVKVRIATIADPPTRRCDAAHDAAPEAAAHEVSSSFDPPLPLLGWRKNRRVVVSVLCSCRMPPSADPSQSRGAPPERGGNHALVSRRA